MRRSSLFACAALVLALPSAAPCQQPAAAPATATDSPATPAPDSPATPAGALPADNFVPPSPSVTEAGSPAAPAVLPGPSPDDPAAQAKDPAFVTAVAAAIPMEPAAYATQPYRLHLHNLHTLEDIDIVYRTGDDYHPEAIARLNYFLRDHYTNDVITYDPREFDLLHDILSRLGRQGSTIDILCGYRTSETNEMLRSNSRGVAEHSQHILGHAIDIRVPGTSTVRLRNAALSLHEGGVGYYPRTQFVHVDVGAIRTWTFSPRRSRHHRRRAHEIATRRHHATHVDGM